MKTIHAVIAALAVGLLAAHPFRSPAEGEKAVPSPKPVPENASTAVFAGGCFWCTEADFEKVDGVIEAVSGYTGGQRQRPTYEQVSAGGTGHVEAVRVVYDPAVIDYEGLLEVFWRSIDPTDAGGQFVDRGSQYRSAIFYADPGQKEKAEASKMRLAQSGVFARPIVTELLPLEIFHEAEDYHQDYARKNPLRYRWYRSGSGRDRFLETTWAGRPMEEKGQADAAPGRKIRNAAALPAAAGGYTRPDDAELRKRLTPLQYEVTRNDATERPFQNEY